MLLNGCENNFGRQEEHRGNGGEETISEGTLPSSLENKGREGRSAIRLASFCYYNVTIKLVLVLMVVSSCLDYLKELIDPKHVFN